MIYLWLFLLFAAAVTAAVPLLGGPLWLGLLLFLPAFLLAHVIFVVTVYFLSRKTDLSRPEEKQNEAVRRAASATGRLLCAYGGLRPVIRGEEKLPTESRFLFVSNHRSLFDPLMVIGCLEKWNISFIAKPSIFRIPLVGSILPTAGYLAIDRENDRKALKTILTAADYMKRGICSIGIYPEGTRTRTGELLPFHSGSFKAAQRAKVPLVIAAVRGTEKLKRGFLLCPHRCTLEILELLPADRVAAMSTHELANYSRGLIAAWLEGEEKA